MLFSMAMTEGIGFKIWQEEKGHTFEFIGIRRAFFHAAARRTVYVQLPAEDESEGMCGMIMKSMYGTRDAAQNWEECYTQLHVGIGFKQGRASTCVFHHEERDIVVVIHGDDFTALGNAEDLDWYREQVKGKMSTKVKGRLGPGRKDLKTMRVLNRIVEWKEHSICYEADQRHAEIICEELGFKKGTKGVVTPGIKSKITPESEEDLEPEQATRYRALVARANYLAQDIPDIQYAAKELCRDMSSPTTRSWEALTRLGIYLIEKPRLIMKFKRQSKISHIEAWVDTDYAGCVRTRKSTSGG